MVGKAEATGWEPEHRDNSYMLWVFVQEKHCLVGCSLECVSEDHLALARRNELASGMKTLGVLDPWPPSSSQKELAQCSVGQRQEAAAPFPPTPSLCHPFRGPPHFLLPAGNAITQGPF